MVIRDCNGWVATVIITYSNTNKYLSIEWPFTIDEESYTSSWQMRMIVGLPSPVSNSWTNLLATVLVVNINKPSEPVLTSGYGHTMLLVVHTISRAIDSLPAAHRANL